MIHDKVGANYCVNTTASQGMSISNTCHFSLIRNEVLCGEFKSSHSRRWKRFDGHHHLLRRSGTLFFSFLLPSSVVGLKTLDGQWDRSLNQQVVEFWKQHDCSIVSTLVYCPTGWFSIFSPRQQQRLLDCLSWSVLLAKILNRFYYPVVWFKSSLRFLFKLFPLMNRSLVSKAAKWNIFGKLNSAHQELLGIIGKHLDICT